MWLATLALLTCLSIDFSNPLLPGVVRFGEGESVDAVRAERPRADVRGSAIAGLLPALGSRLPDLVMALPRASVRVSDRTRPVSAALPRGRPGGPPASSPIAGEDH